MCKGLSSLPSSCLERAKGMRVKLTHLADKQEWSLHHKHRILENKALPDLESLLGSKIGQKAFRCFLQSEFSEENLEFWMSCEEYNTTPVGLQEAKARSMYNRFLHPGAPQEVNLDAETREAVLRALEDPAGDTFYKAQQHVYNLMAKDSYRRFLRSPHCLQALRAP